MNMKGISPVVATVLLIAIAVIAAVGVWYWVGSYTSKPATTGTDLKVIDVTCSITSTSVMVRNMGTLAIPTSTVFYVYNMSNTLMGNITTTSSIASTSTASVALSPASVLAVGSYRAISNGFQDTIFTCY